MVHIREVSAMDAADRKGYVVSMRETTIKFTSLFLVKIDETRYASSDDAGQQCGLVVPFAYFALIGWLWTRLMPNSCLKEPPSDVPSRACEYCVGVEISISRTIRC